MQRRIALITGGASPLGAHLARHLAHLGYDLALHYYQSAKEAVALAEALGQNPNRIALFQQDLSLPQGAQSLGEAVLAKMGGVDLLIHGASDFWRAPLLATDEKAWDRLLALQVKAPALLTQTLVDSLKNRRGQVIFISDLAGSQAWSPYGVHAVTRAAQDMQLRLLARDLAPEIRVNMVKLGLISPSEGEATPGRLAAIPLGRVGSPDDLLKAVDYLCMGTYLTGETLFVDGGRGIV